MSTKISFHSSFDSLHVYLWQYSLSSTGIILVAGDRTIEATVYNLDSEATIARLIEMFEHTEMGAVVTRGFGEDARHSGYVGIQVDVHGTLQGRAVGRYVDIGALGVFMPWKDEPVRVHVDQAFWYGS